MRPEGPTLKEIAFNGGEEAFAKDTLPTETMEDRTLVFWRRFPKAIDVYWLP